MNKMTVTDVWAGRKVQIKVNDPSYSFKDYFQSEKHITLFIQALACNTIGTVDESSATECAMLKMLEKFGVLIS